MNKKQNNKKESIKEFTSGKNKLTIRGSQRSGPEAIYSDRLDSLKEEMVLIRKEFDFFEIQIDQEYRKTIIRCEDSNSGDGCGKQFPINTVTYVKCWSRAVRYDCLDDGRGFSDPQFICPKCGLRNRLYLRKSIINLQKYFKETINEEEQ